MPVWLNLVLALGGSAIISTLVASIASAISRETKKKREQREKNEQDAIRGILKEELAEVKEISQMNQEGLVACLRRNILAEWNTIKNRGNYCTREEKENLDHMIEAYVKLGGNSFVQHTIIPYLDEEVDVITRQEEAELIHREKTEKEGQLKNFKELIGLKKEFKDIIKKMDTCPFSVDPAAVKAAKASTKKVNKTATVE